MARSFPMVSGIASDWMSVSDVAATGTPLSMAAWIYESVSDRTCTILGEVNTIFGVSEAFMLQGTSGSGISAVAVNAGSTRSSTTGVYSTGAWHHAGAVFTGATSRTAYLDGSAATTDTSSCTPGSMSSTIAGYYFSGGTQTTLIAEAAIWNAALTNADMLELSKGFSPNQVRPESLVRYWRITGRNSPEIDIRSGVAMSLTGTCAFADHPRIIYRPTQIVVPAAAAAGGGGFFGSPLMAIRAGHQGW